MEISEETYDSTEPYGCFVEPDDDELYEDPLRWMFPDEESVRDYRVWMLERRSELDSSEELYDDEDEAEAPPYRLLDKISSEQIRLVKPFAREFFLAKAIEFCSMSVEKLCYEGSVEFPPDDFSPEGRRRVEDQSNESFVKLYNMTASDEALKTGIQYVNRALKTFEDLFIWHYREGGQAASNENA